MVYFMENPKLKWMRTGGTPSLGNLQMENVQKKNVINNPSIHMIRIQ
jgi:hypothetical protein